MKLATLSIGADATYTGRFNTASLNSQLEIKPVNHQAEAGPSHSITVAGNEIGALWPRTVAKGDRFWIGHFDDPMFPKPIRVTMFAPNDGTATLVWDRPKT